MTLVSALSIGALARATGVPVNTLRTWERRYGFPRSDRLPSGHRRYADDQVQHIQWIHRAIRQGYKPSALEALNIHALQALVQPVEPQETVLRPAAPPTPPTPPTPPSPSRPARLTTGDAIERWLRCVDRLDMAGLEKELLKAWSHHGAVGLLDNYVKPFLIEVGRQWRAGRYTVSQEHAATECVGGFLADRWRRLASGSTGPAVVLATLPGEQHILGLHQVAVALAMHGYRVHFLGRGAPVPALLAAVAQLKPMALMVGVSLAASPQKTRADLDCLREAIDPQIHIVIGGAGAPQTVDGILTLTSIAEVDEWAEKNFPR